MLQSIQARPPTASLDAGDQLDPEKSHYAHAQATDGNKEGPAGLNLYPYVEEIREGVEKIRSYATLVFNHPPTFGGREKWFVLKNSRIKSPPGEIFLTTPMTEDFRKTALKIELVDKPGEDHIVYFHSRFLVGLKEGEAEADKRKVKYFYTQRRKKERDIYKAYTYTVDAFEESHKPWNGNYSHFTKGTLSIKRWQEGLDLVEEQLRSSEFG